jgi:hypothetical protein
MNCAEVIKLLTYYDTLSINVLLFTALAPHNDGLIHPMHGIELRTFTECFQNEK